MSSSATLHIVNQSGGGTMRYIEALIHSPVMPSRQFVWYVGNHQHILFDVQTPYYYAFSADLLTEQLQRLILTLIRRTGVTQLGIHLHSFYGQAFAAIEQFNNFPLTATLHDHHFLSETPFIHGDLQTDENHIQRIQHLLKDAHILVPSRYLLEQASPYFDKNQLHFIEHGVEPPINQLDDDTLRFIEQLKTKANWKNNIFTVATIGAIGEDKGLAFMKQWLKTAKDTQFVCIGYTADFSADQNRPCAENGRIIHGFYHHAEVAALLRAYAVDVVVFFPGIAESFCYALSDMDARVPVLAPDNGALGERVRKAQLGSVYDKNITTDELTENLKQAAKQTVLRPIHQQTTETMTLQTAHYYQQLTIDDVLKVQMPSEELSNLLADQLHSDNLKWELAILVRQNYDLSNVYKELEKSNADVEHQGRYIDEQRQYIQKLQADLEHAQQALHSINHSFSRNLIHPLQAVRRLINKIRK